MYSEISQLTPFASYSFNHKYIVFAIASYQERYF